MDQSSTYLNGWFGDYLFFNSTTLMNGYNTFGPNDFTSNPLISDVSNRFLLAHLCWATGFMFLISWRGYWQELMDMILVMHLNTTANLVQSLDRRYLYTSSFIYSSSKVCWRCSFLYWIYFNLCSFYYRCHFVELYPSC